MTRKNIIVAAVSGVLLLGTGTFMTTQAMAQGGARGARGAARRAERERHPEIRRAMHALQNAKDALKSADTDFGGHRVKALDDVDHALEECKDALKFDK